MHSVTSKSIFKLKKYFSRETCNVFLLGISFTFLFMAFSTTQALSVSSLKNVFPPTNVTQNILIENIGYYTLLLLYVIFTLSNLFAPGVVKLLGPKASLIISGLTYVLFVSVYIYPLVYTLYSMACIIGIGAAVLWTSQGKLLLDNSNPQTVERNSGIFTAIFVFNFIPGNLFVFLYLGNSTEISTFQRFIIFSFLTLLGLIGVFFFFFIRPLKRNRLVEVDTLPYRNHVKNYFNDFSSGIWDMIRISFRIESFLLFPIYYISGLSINIYAGSVYATCFGTVKAPLYRVGFGALSLLLAGVGGVVGSSIFAVNGRLSCKITLKSMLLIAVFIDFIASILIYYNMPPYCNLPNPHSDVQLLDGELIKPSNIYVALLCSVLLGFSDSIVKSIIYSSISLVYEKSLTAPAVGLYKFFESLSLTFSFFYNPLLNLGIQIVIFEIAICFTFVSYIIFDMRVSLKLKQKKEIELQYPSVRVIPQDSITLTNSRDETSHL